MNRYVVSYDLVKRRNYQDLSILLRYWQASIQISESTWCIVTDQSAKQVRDHLKQALDDDDKLIVFKLTGEWAATGTLDKKFDWLWKHVGAKS